ncbi:MAG: metallophosphoesterase family protein [Acidimicrobiales bacterium]
MPRGGPGPAPGGGQAGGGRPSRWRPAAAGPGDGELDVALELTTVADDEVVLHDGPQVHRHLDLPPDRELVLDGISVHTLPRPPGERLSTIATVNDVHFGETECGVIEGLELGPVLRSGEGEPPYPETMNAAAVEEIAATAPDLIVAKGDLTARGSVEEYRQFLAVYAEQFGDRLVHVRGNHDGYAGETFADEATQEVVLPGVRVAVLDTTRPTETPGQVTADQLAWLDELAGRSDRPVLVFGHHHPWSPDSAERPDTYFGINPTDSEHLVEVVARRPAIVGYLSGHTHRNRVRHFRSTGGVPWVEVACVKDYPGSWAEYRVHEGGILQVHRRISRPDALDWTERTRAMFGGLYPAYAFGRIQDRCFLIRPRA